MYVPLPQSLEGFYLNWGMDVVVRGVNPPSPAQIRAAVRDAFADAVIFRVASMEEIVALSAADRRFQLIVLLFFAVLALGLATIGVAGTLLLAVRERADELAVQIALGARASRLWWQIQREGLFLASLGAVLGVAGAMAAGRVFASLVYEVPVRDALSLVAAPLVMLMACFVAAAIPAVRALRVDPLRALRS
jgi:putative ABC transport system permease protein